jgi:hypothetical protein
MGSRAGARAGPLGWSLPNEHGFWTMLAASVLGALFRTGLSWTSIAAAEVALTVTVLLAGIVHRRIRAQNWVQMLAIAALSLVGAAVELFGSVPLPTIVAGIIARTTIFLACALLVRAAFARSNRSRQERARNFDIGAISLPLGAGVGFALSGYTGEARACLLAGIVAIPIALGRATSKQLKPLGIALAVITLATAIVLSL